MRRLFTGPDAEGCVGKWVGRAGEGAVGRAGVDGRAGNAVGVWWYVGAAGVEDRPGITVEVGWRDDRAGVEGSAGNAVRGWWRAGSKASVKCRLLGCAGG